MRITLTILFFLLCTFSFAQQSTPKEEVYMILRTGNIFNLPYRETAKKAFENYISKFSTNPYRLVAKYWLAEILNRFYNSDSARLLYRQLLTIPIPDSVDDANYRYSSTIRLAEISINNANYIAALHYLDIERKQFVPKFDCGNARIQDNIQLKLLYSKCYMGQGNYNKAIDTLAPYIFSSRWYVDSTELIDKLYEAYLKVYTKQETKNEFLNAEKTLVIKREQYYSNSYLQPTIKVFGKEIKFRDDKYNLNKLTEQEQRQKCIETIRQSAIYRLATL